MGEEPRDVLFGVFGVCGGCVGCGVEFGYIDGFVVCVAQEVEGEVEKARQYFVLLDVLNVVVLYFERLELLV